MRIRAFIATLAGLLVTLASGPSAAADELTPGSAATWPSAEVERPLVLGDGMLEIAGDTVLINASSGAFAEPISFAPDVRYGVSDRLTLQIDHEVGLCLGGEDRGCPSSLADFAVEGMFSLLRGDLAVAGKAGYASPSISPYAGGVEFGVTIKLRAAELALVFDPALYVGLFGRDDAGDRLSLPLVAFYQLNPRTALIVESGVVGPLDGFGDAYRVPIAVGATVAVTQRIDLGGVFGFDNAAGADADGDLRHIALRAALRL